MTIEKKDLETPLLLTADLFTPLRRTPWAGDRITAEIKNELYPQRKTERVGESWEFSCDPDFPSLLAKFDISVEDLVSRFPQEILSPAVAEAWDNSCQILVKLLHASTPLSVQVHPDDDNPKLQQHECGKPESWFVIAADEGAGLYLGFKQSVDKETLKSVFMDSDKGKNLLQFVPVKPGDFFDLGPGVPHAVGEGVLLLEPQRILSGKSGKTYRLWDWGRKYDDNGNLDMAAGTPRQLHIDQSLAVMDPKNQWGDKFVDSLRRSPKTITGSGFKVFSYPTNDYYKLVWLEFSPRETLSLAINHGFIICVPVDGQMQMKGGLEVAKGQPVLMPYSSFPQKVNSVSSGKVAFIGPSSMQLTINGQSV